MWAIRARLGSVFMQVVGMRLKKPQGRGQRLIGQQVCVFSFAQQYSSCLREENATSKIEHAHIPATIDTF